MDGGDGDNMIGGLLTRQVVGDGEGVAGNNALVGTVHHRSKPVRRWLGTDALT